MQDESARPLGRIAKQRGKRQAGWIPSIISADDELAPGRSAGAAQAAGLDEVAIQDAGECALVVELGQTIDHAINDRVIALDEALAEAGVAGIEEVMPTYRSLMIHYDPLVLSRAELRFCVMRLLSRPVAARPSRRWVFPACYDDEFALDMKEIAWSLGLSERQVIDLHASVPYRIYMHGFAPGLPAMGGLPEPLRLPRRMVPRPEVVEGSLIIVARQASIASVNMPCGWHVLGRTPERLFVLERTPTVLTATGDEIRFEPIDRHAFASLRARALAGETVATVVA